MKENKRGQKWKGEESLESREEQSEKEIQRAPENRLQRAHQQREAKHKAKGSEKEVEVSRVLSGFFLLR